MTNCPWNAAMSPWWYQLEVVKGTNTEPAASKKQSDTDITTKETETKAGSQDETVKTTSGKGTFQVVRQNHEIQLCNYNSVSFFVASNSISKDCTNIISFLAVSALHYRWQLVHEWVQEATNECYSGNFKFPHLDVHCYKEYCQNNTKWIELPKTCHGLHTYTPVLWRALKSKLHAWLV